MNKALAGFDRAVTPYRSRRQICGTPKPSKLKRRKLVRDWAGKESEACFGNSRPEPDPGSLPYKGLRTECALCELTMTANKNGCCKLCGIGARHWLSIDDPRYIWNGFPTTKGFRESDPEAQVRYDRFRRDILRALRDEPIEEGIPHPVEAIIENALQADESSFLWVVSLFDNLEDRPSLCSDILRCIGRLERSAVSIWGIRMARRGLSHSSVQLRDAAVRAFEFWGGPTSIRALTEHSEPIDRLRDYINKVIARELGLEEWQKLYTIRELSEVGLFLEKNGFLEELLIEAYGQLQQFFPGDVVSLEVSVDPEDPSDRQLVLSIRTAHGPAEALRILDAFDDAWWLGALVRAEGKVCVNLEFV